MRKFFSVILAVALTVCFTSAVLAITSTTMPENGGVVKILWKGQEIDPATLSTNELYEYYGYRALHESNAMMAAMDATASTLTVPNIENLYGAAIDAVVKKHRNDFLSDLAVAIMEQGTGGSSYQDPGQYAPYESAVHIIEYFVERAVELGFEVDGQESRIVKVMAPNYVVPPHKRTARLPGMTDTEYWLSDSLFPLYMYVELGAKSLPEVTFNVCHMDPWEDTGSIRGDRGGWNDPIDPGRGGVFITPIHVASPNRFWTLGGSHQANVIRDPVTMRWVMVGRGSDDDRGPGVAMLYSLKAIKDAGIPLRRRIRCMFGTTEDASTMFRQVQTMVPMYGSTSFQDMAWYTQQDEWPIMGTTADAGRFPVMLGQATVNANISNIILEWTNNPTTGIGLRFPNVLDYTSESSGGSVISAANQWGSGGGTWPNFTDGAPTALPAVLYNQARDAFVYKAYFAGMTSGHTANGQNLQLVTWLVPPAGATEANVTALLNAANAVKNSYRINWGGWEYPDEKNNREAIQKVPLAGRWDAGIDIIRVDTRTGQTYGSANANANAVQVITKGHIVRFWDKEYFSCRHIMIDFLSKIVIPSGFTAPWQMEMRKFTALYPFDNYRERKIWDGSTLVGNYLGRKMYVGTLSSVNDLTPTFTTPISEDSSYVPAGAGHAAEAWTNRYTNASESYVNRGRNDENVSRVTAGIAFLYPAAATPDDNVYFNGLIHGTLLAPAVRLRLNDVGLSGTIGDTSNVTNPQYVAVNADAIWKAYNAYNNYYKAFGVPASGYTGELKEDRPEVYNGGTYANSFRLPTQGMNAANLDGRLIATGGWGGRGTLHSWNERVELDGMVDFVKRMARVFTEYASGVPHTWTISGAAMTPATGIPYKGFVEKGKLEYAVSNDTRPGIYIQEEKVGALIIASLFSSGQLSRDETVEFLFARKFRKDDANFTLTTNLTDVVGGPISSGKVYMFAKEGTGDDLTAVWTQVAVGTAGSAAFTFTDGSVYDQLTAINSVEVSVIALVVTNGASTPLSLGAAGTDADENGKIDDFIDDIIEDRVRDRVGCNAGFAFLALMVIPIVVRRRK